MNTIHIEPFGQRPSMPGQIMFLDALTMPKLSFDKDSFVFVQDWEVDGKKVIGLVVGDQRVVVCDLDMYDVSNEAQRHLNRQLSRVQVGIAQAGVDLAAEVQQDVDPRAEFVRRTLRTHSIGDMMRMVDNSMRSFGPGSPDDQDIAATMGTTGETPSVEVTVEGQTFTLDLEAGVGLELSPLAEMFVRMVRERISATYHVLPLTGKDQLILYVFTGVVDHTGTPTPTYTVARVPMSALHSDMTGTVQDVVNRF